MRYPTVAAFAASCTLGACGGNVVVDGVSTGSGAAPSTSGTAAGGATQSGTGAGTTNTSGTPITGSTGTQPSGGSSGTTCVTSCAEALAMGATPCQGLGFADYGALLQCSCGSGALYQDGGSCSQICDMNACQFHAVTSGCQACMASTCPVELSSCLAN